MNQQGSHCEGEASPLSLQGIPDPLTYGPRDAAGVNTVAISYHNVS